MSERQNSQRSPSLPERLTRAVSKSRSPRKGDTRDHSLFVNSIEKAVMVLNAFSRERPRLTLAVVTKLTGLDKSAAQRFLFTLHQLGLVRKHDETKQYSLSPRLLEFAYAYTYSDGLIERAQQFLVEAHEKTGETVNLMVLDGTDVILVWRIPSLDIVAMNVQVGLRMPALYSIAGRAIVAQFPPKEREFIIRATNYQKYTDEAVTNPNEMRKLLEKASKDGYVLSQSQYFHHETAVGAAIIDGSKKVLGGISLSGPGSRLTVQEAREKLLPATITAARKISLAMGAY
ncbi:IclR family transcriptional regulator [Bradyrhizobium sp. 4]|uniref:IclR family transcriptional regulator n=1 Tax=unclassified Bradyrhizobium TaxID=2631580 RepID=UPI001FF7E438|nr:MULTISPECIES: IclR family transcriptional regulator [unclassified Bradyrhizobium]MCK1396993.1 IclR family transcriptional regulator [Bradyrhizobium sp. 39]MCK1632627.1 IclR family transcriptional regulator [Bradyrhizobium sp. 162]MCK1752269.1 IclR family transcriptional regulator [Bradyrhizobium sp. 135]UPJ36367.1 IclR family transcriptional regulator [Bradyrhizobium sp. 4]